MTTEELNRIADQFDTEADALERDAQHRAARYRSYADQVRKMVPVKNVVVNPAFREDGMFGGVR